MKQQGDFSMLNDDLLKNVTRELWLTYFNNYLLKVGAITKRQHSKMYLLILKRTSTHEL